VNLAPGEHVLFEGHPSWRSTLTFYIKGIAAVIVVAAVAALASLISGDGVKGGWVGGAAVAAFVLVLVVGYLRRLATVYTITNRRLHIKRGLISRRTQEARLERVQNVNTDQSALERVLRVGTVDFDTAGGDSDHEFKFAGVAEPSGVVQRVDEAQREHAAEADKGL
jgi:uncharacterized membrane protein YdbT with pleckstrin-like domain